MFNFYQCVIKFQMSYTFFEPVGKLLLLDLSYGFSSRIMQCNFVFTVKNKVIYFQLNIVDNIQNLIKQYMHMKSHTLNKALAQDYCTTSTNEQYQAMHETSCHHFAYHLQVEQSVKNYQSFARFTKIFISFSLIMHNFDPINIQRSVVNTFFENVSLCN